MQSIHSRLQHVKNRIQAAEYRFSRQAGSVQLLAVSKAQTVDSIRQAIDAGQQHFGENYLQESCEKIEILGRSGIYWHFIGRIQSNKTQEIATQFDWVHSVDRLKIATRLSQHRPETLSPLNICLQVNIDNQTSKAGFNANELHTCIKEIDSLPKIRLRGLMAIPAATDDEASQRKPFANMRALLQDLTQRGYFLDTLSMGMSNDMEAAIAEGATIVRVGTAIFGPRG